MEACFLNILFLTLVNLMELTKLIFCQQNQSFEHAKPRRTLRNTENEYFNYSGVS